MVSKPHRGSRVLGCLRSRRSVAVTAALLSLGSVGLFAPPGLAGKTEDIVATSLDGNVSEITVLEVGRSLFVYGTLAKSNADIADNLCRDAAAVICELFPGRSVLAEWRYDVREKHSCERQRCSQDGTVAPNGREALPPVDPAEPATGG